MNKISKTITVAAIVCSCLPLNAFSQATSKRVMGLDQARHFNHRVSGNIYIQTASFSVKSRAVSYQKFLQSKVNTPVSIQQNSGFYRVVIGPLHTAEQVRMVGQKALGNKVIASRHQMPQPIKTQVVSRPTKTPVISKPIKTQAATRPAVLYKEPLTMPQTPSQGWYAAAEVSIQSTSAKQMSVGNNSGAPSPFDKDIYTANSNNNPIVAGVGLGKRWERDDKWLPSYSLGLRYQHLFASNLSGQVLQYSLPLYTNYNYDWSISSDAITALGKFDIIRFYKVSPYVSAGAGVAINKASQYSEIALPGIIPRISPGFASQNKSHFTYTVGAGLDFRMTQNLSVSAGYEFQDWGSLSSGPGTVHWASQKLTQNNYQSNKLLLSADYWFNT